MVAGSAARAGTAKAASATAVAAARAARRESMKIILRMAPF
jgi:hypothetical protein